MGSLGVSDKGSQNSSFQGSETFLRDVFGGILNTYLRKNPTVHAIWELVRSDGDDRIFYDHFTFRTLFVDGYGIDSLSSFFMEYGYKVGGGMDFPEKKLRVLWFSPPQVHVPVDGHGLDNGPLPRLVIAEVLVDELSPTSQEIIRKYLKPGGGKQAVLSSTLGSLMWEKPTSTDFKQLAKESEIAAWTLVHGYTMNHLAFAVHRMKNGLGNIQSVKDFLQGKGFKLNKEGGIVKVSEDSLLLQISSISERLEVEFADGVTESIPASYIEFTERLVLPQYKDVPGDEIKELHRREGFELESANNVMESTRFTVDHIV
ncbi:PREDICTED: uncharacterized protein LOC104822097 [Tarenaya hassleriana]|uniref:uncharacterized protein LOC104822097 n=1 Tax=Tarenaya hassleriana TaxID=28532 RepID=UPI00053C5ED4|nr:PREDICTED: uncharacterized protein LOC104822097 [Tarenaya hassleriana]